MVDVRVRQNVAVVIIGVFFLAGLGGVQATVPVEECPKEDVVGTDHWIESHDGVALKARLWYNTSHAQEALPVVLLAHGWAGDRHGHEGNARWLVDNGYVALAWDARGFGESQGTVGLNGPDEWADVSAIIDWLLDEDLCPALLLDGPENPRLGMFGASYGGVIQIMASAQDDRIDAIVPDITWHDLVHSLAPQEIVKRGWVDLLYASGELSSHGLMYTPPNPNTGGMDNRLTQWYAEATLTGRLPEDAVEALLMRSPVSHLDSVGAHALVTQGYNDTLFLPDEATANYEALKGREDAETHLLFHPVGHGHSMSDSTRESYRSLVLSFFDRHLKEDPEVAALAPVTYYDPEVGAFVSADAWPPEGSSSFETGLQGPGGEDTVSLVQTPVPTSTTDFQQFSGEYNEFLGPYASEHQDLVGATSVLLDVELDSVVSVVGRPMLSLAVTPHVDEATLFVSLVDPHRDDVVYNQVTLVRLEGNNGERVELDLSLSSLSYRFEGGSLQVRVTTSDLGFHGARVPGTVDLHLEEASLGLTLGN